MTDIWLPRLHLLAQVALLVVCAALIGTGHDSTITDLFCAGAGGVLATTTYAVVTQRKKTTPTD
jgi:hypothetical protein